MMKVRKVMSRSIHAVAPETSIGQVAEDMLKFDIGAMPVLRDEQIVGIVTDRDIVVRAVARGLANDRQVSEIMSHPVLCCGSEDSLADVVDRMGEEQIRRMPVRSESGYLLGMLSLGDVVRADVDCEEVADAVSAISRPFGRHCQTRVAA